MTSIISEKRESFHSVKYNFDLFYICIDFTAKYEINILCVYTSRVKYSVDSDHLVSENLSDLDLHCLFKQDIPGFYG